MSERDSWGDIQSERGSLDPTSLGQWGKAIDEAPSSITGIVGTMMKMYSEHKSATQAAVIARRRRVPIELPPEPVEEASELQSGGGFWELLDGWARRHQVDSDLALLTCACATAHASGAHELFAGHDEYQKTPAPTLIGHAEDKGFHLAVQGATLPFLSMQKELEVRYGSLRKKSYRSMRRDRFHYKMSNACLMHDQFNIRGLHEYEDLEPEGTVRFVVDGKLPKMPYRALPRCHHYKAMCVGEIEALPQSTRGKEDRVDALVSIIQGYGHSIYAIRGFMRFSAVDLEWVLTNRSGLCLWTLPIRSDLMWQPAEHLDVASANAGFDRIHRKTARHILRLRYDDSKCAINFGDEQVAEYYKQLRAEYRRGCMVVSPLAELTVNLGDVIVWYLLHVSSVSGIRIEPMDIATRANEMARRLRRRVVEILDQYEAIRRGRLKRKQVLRLLVRMEKLGVPSTARDIARGLNKQRMVKISPLIDFLIEHHVFVRDQRKLKAAPDARKVFDLIPLERFMPALRDLPFSLTTSLEEFESREAASASITSSPI